MFLMSSNTHQLVLLGAKLAIPIAFQLPHCYWSIVWAWCTTACLFLIRCLHRNLYESLYLFSWNHLSRDIEAYLVIKKPWKHCTAISSLLGIVSSANPRAQSGMWTRNGRLWVEPLGHYDTAWVLCSQNAIIISRKLRICDPDTPEMHNNPAVITLLTGSHSNFALFSPVSLSKIGKTAFYNPCVVHSIRQNLYLYLYFLPWFKSRVCQLALCYGVSFRRQSEPITSGCFSVACNL